MKNVKCAVAALLSILLLSLASAWAAPYADSVANFSGVQGSNGWVYGYYDVTGDAIPGYDPTNDFAQCTIWNGSTWWADANYVTSFAPAKCHPSGSASSPNWGLREQWPIRRWVSTVTDSVIIHGHISKDNTTCGDGVTAMILVNGQSVLNQQVAAGDLVGSDYSISIQVRTNDLVDFAVSAGCCGDGSCDGTIFTAIIDHAIKLDIRTAVEVGVSTVTNQQYQMQTSSNLQSWQAIGTNFTGTGGTVYFLYSTRILGPSHYFRAVTVP